MKIETTRDRELIADYYHSNPGLHIYEIGDLDDFFFPQTEWHAGSVDGKVQALCLLYRDPITPVLLALSSQRTETYAALLRAVHPRLPPRCYAHISPCLANDVTFRAAPIPHLKMVLSDPARLQEHATERVAHASARPCRPNDVHSLGRFYRAAYPNNWFVPRMVETGAYEGLQNEAGEWLAVAGVHVYSATRAVAALGNVATLPTYRGNGLAKTVVARLCLRLLGKIRVIGLNVAADNAPAIRCYEQLGFEIVAEYLEGHLSNKLAP